MDRPYVPREHGLGSALPMGQNVPALHRSQALSCSSMGASPTVPAGQSDGAGLPARQKVPFGHITGSAVAVPHQ